MEYLRLDIHDISIAICMTGLILTGAGLLGSFSANESYESNFPKRCCFEDDGVITDLDSAKELH